MLFGYFLRPLLRLLGVVVLPAVFVLSLGGTATAFLIVGKQGSTEGLDAIGELRGTVGKTIFQCSGVLIDSSHFLTAGHCAPDGATVEVYLKGGAVVAKANNPVMPPPIAEEKDPTLNVIMRTSRDVGVFTLEAPIPNSVVKPMEIADGSAEIERFARTPESCLLTGFSFFDLEHQWFHHPPNPAGGTRLRTTAWQPVYDPNVISQTPFGPYWERLRESFAISGPNHFATGGDSGGPLVCPAGNGAWKIIAINETTSAQSVYGSYVGVTLASWVTNYLDWLHDLTESRDLAR